MCAETQNQLDRLAKQVGNTEGIKRARIIIGNQDKTAATTKKELTKIKQDIAILQELAEEREKNRQKDIADIRVELAENTKKTNLVTDTVMTIQSNLSDLQKKITESEWFQNAAAASIVMKICSTKSGKLFIFFMSCCMGLALAYIIKEVPSIVDIVKQVV